MQIRDYLIRRLMILPILLIGVSLIVFTLSRVGGSPIGIYLSHEMTPDEVAEIEERYGLFTIIVLGESVLAAVIGVQTAIDADADLGDLGPVVVGGLLILFSMWWLYFDLPEEQIVHRARQGFTAGGRSAFAWGYGHYVVFASIAATGAGLAVAGDRLWLALRCNPRHGECADPGALAEQKRLLHLWDDAPLKVSTFEPVTSETPAPIRMK